jgi:hypothetical protein
MFEPTERILTMVDELYTLTVPLNRGDILPHEAISRVCGVDPHARHYQWCLRKLARRLQAERGIAIWNEPKIGYRLLTVADQLNIPSRKRILKAKRQINKLEREVTCLAVCPPTEGLTLHQQIVLGHRIEQAQTMKRELLRKLMEQERINRRPDVMPRVVGA